VAERGCIEWLRDEAGRGRRLVLATAADASLAARVAVRFGFFSAVLASDGERNLKGPHKLAAIRAHAGDGGFDYVRAIAPRSLTIFAAARTAIVVAASPRVERDARSTSRVERVFRDEGSSTAWLRALRPHQWLKNLLVFVPLVTAFAPGIPWR
jgi:hypothetical protein